MRYGSVQELSRSLSEQDIKNIPKPQEKSIKWNIDKIDKKSYLAITSRYPGAYVKDPYGGILDSNDGLLIDLDASSLYPFYGGSH